jgi:hypothetical protein
LTTRLIEVDVEEPPGVPSTSLVNALSLGNRGSRDPRSVVLG